MSLRTVSAQLCALLPALACSIAHAGQTIILSTNENRIDPEAANQGWWSNSKSTNTFNISWFLGSLDGGQHRNFATYLLPDFDQPVVAASLSFNRRGSAATNEATETIGFFDVSTSPQVLNNNTGPNSTIYGDLGSGVSYGEVTVSGAGPPTEVLDFPLNSMGVAAINGAAPGYFSIGGRLLTDDGNDYFFGGGGSGLFNFVTLTLTVVPEPSTIVLGPLLVAGAAMRRRAARKAQ
jgi:hypothetical protein